jgi:two-component system chemotaxis response regulator CheB
MVRIRQAGGVTIAESEESCVVYGMPYQAFARGGAEIVLPSWEIADRLIRILGAKTEADPSLSRKSALQEAHS